MTDQSPPAIFWLLLGMTVLYLGSMLYMFSYLKRLHPEAWDKLGRPSFLNNSIQNNFLFFGFMIRRKYLALGDPTLNQLCLSIWMLFGLCAVLMVMTGFQILT